jgi:hypothetical protein
MLLSREAFINAQVRAFISYKCSECEQKSADKCAKCKQLKLISKSAGIIWDNEQEYEDNFSLSALKIKASKQFDINVCQKCNVHDGCSCEYLNCALWFAYWQDILSKIGYETQ